MNTEALYGEGRATGLADGEALQLTVRRSSDPRLHPTGSMEVHSSYVVVGLVVLGLGAEHIWLR